MKAQKKKYGNQSAALLIRSLKSKPPKAVLEIAEQGLALKNINAATRGEFLWAMGTAYTDMGDQEKGRTYHMRVINEKLYRYPGEENALQYQKALQGENYKTFVASETAREAAPIVRIPPFMPQNRQASGHCEMLFDVTETGMPINVKTVYCTDAVFSKPAITSVRKWKYNPRVVDGKAVEANKITTIIHFQLRDDCGNILPEP